jgi:excisionase family DNA binding protein
VSAADLLVTMTRAELRSVIAEAIAEALATKSTHGEWLDSKSAAKLIGCAPRSVQKFARRSGLPSHRIGEKLLRYRRSEVLAWMEGRR